MAKNILQNSCDLVSVTPTAGTNQLAAPFGLVKIKSQALSAVTSVQYTGLANYPYNNYKLVVSKFTTSGVTQSCLIQISTNNGSSYIALGYQSGANYAAYNTATYTNTNFTTGLVLFTNALNGGVGNSGSSWLDIANINIAAGSFIHATGQESWQFNTVNNFNVLLTGGYTVSVTANAFQILLSSGTMSGTFSLYGYS